MQTKAKFSKKKKHKNMENKLKHINYGISWLEA